MAGGDRGERNRDRSGSGPSGGNPGGHFRRNLRRGRVRPGLLVVDAAILVVIYSATLVLRFENDVPPRYWRSFFEFLPFAVVGHLVANWGFGLYREMWKHASINQAVRAVLACALAGVVFVATSPLWNERVPLAVLVFAPVTAALLLTGLRFRNRVREAATSTRTARRQQTQGGLRILVLGAGSAGGSIIREFQRNPSAGMRPVAILDDDLRKAGMALAGVPVVGTIDDIAATAETHRADQVLLAIPSADQAVVRRVAAACDAAELPLRVLPPVHELLGGHLSVRDVRDLSIEDLVGRQQATIDMGRVRELLAGRRVLITGAGGSIGAEIARQVAALGPSRLILLDHDETHLHDVAAALNEAPVATVLADIRDREWVETHFRRVRPEIVFHAAAHKHVPVLEEHPVEAFLTNVVGTKNVTEAAAAVGVLRLVLISTDKAVRPTSVMGASKRLAEHTVLSHASAGDRFCAVRFGNVLGSRGSVIPSFARQISAGGPVTVTDPAMTRFFLSTREAVQLVLQAAVLCKGREVFMLDMGQAVNILDLAKRMIRLAGKTPGVDIEITFTGPRPGEKLMEELCAPDEVAEPTEHAAIRRLSTTVMARDAVDYLIDRLLIDAAGCDDAAVGRALRQVGLWEEAGAERGSELDKLS